MLVTVFTPTYNRANTLSPLFHSLEKQSCKSFEWVIVDDGSIDNTEMLCRNWEALSSFPVRYFKQPNGGKHRAVNYGVQLAKGNLFFIVDSDDILPANSIECILVHYKDVCNNPSIGGVCGLKASYNGELVSKGSNFDIVDCSSIEIRTKYHMTGDMAEVIRTDVMKEFPFPEFDGERFCPEALLFNRIAQKYRLRYFSEVIYLCEYRRDGLTSSIDTIRMKSPRASSLCYYEFFKCDIPFVLKIRYAINYWRFFYCINENPVIQRNNTDYNLGWGQVLKPVGFIYHLFDKTRYERV